MNRSLGNRVVAARPERMTARKTTQGKPATAKRTVAFERLDGVGGAAWIITARGGQERGQRHLISANEQDERGPHVELRPGAGDTRLDRLHVRSQCVERRGVRVVPRANGDVDRRLRSRRARGAQRRQELDAHELPEAALEAIAIDGGVLVTRHDDPDARRAERGSEDPDIEMHGPNSLPLSNDGLYVRAPRQPVATRKSKAVVMRLRTCSGA
jgi:hypothetical protein